MLNILDWFRSQSRVGRTATDLYGSIVTQARLPIFYTRYGVEDVAEKRYEMIVLHMVMVLERLRVFDEEGMELGRELIETFVRDLDGSIREMALGDTKVPNNVKKAAAGLMDRDVLYREAFEGTSDRQGRPDDMTLEALLDELVFGGSPASSARVLASYVTASRRVLSNWSHGDGVERIAFADPELTVAG